MIVLSLSQSIIAWLTRRISESSQALDCVQFDHQTIEIPAGGIEPIPFSVHKANEVMQLSLMLSHCFTRTCDAAFEPGKVEIKNESPEM
jgi:hypothetical protein